MIIAVYSSLSPSQTLNNVTINRHSSFTVHRSPVVVSVARRPLKVICVTYLPLVGYTILLRDLLAPLAEVILGRTLDGMARNLMVSALVILVRLKTAR